MSLSRNARLIKATEPQGFAFPDPLRPIALVSVRVRERDPILEAMHRQEAPWTAEQWAFAEALEDASGTSSHDGRLHQESSHE